MKDPQSYVRCLAQTGSIVIVDRNIPIHRYFRSGLEMLRMAKMYADEGQLENAFILYTKYTTLFIEKIPKHPEYNILSNVKKIETKQALQSVFIKAEEIKAELLSDYKKKYEIWKVQKEREEVEERLRQMQFLEEEEEKAKKRDEFEKEKDWRILQGKEMMKNIEVDLTDMPDLEEGDSNDSRPSTVTPSPSLYSSDLSILSVTSPSPSTPSIDRSTKPSSLLSPGPDSMHYHGLRIVVVPSSGIDTFLNLAQPSTMRNIEMCGILAGKITRSELVITHLLLPKQTGTSDSCSTDNEEDLFLYQDKLNLITLGWIHTHPSQTAFMSSVDLHTHCSYQLMMPEAIAIVCSPKYKQTSVFSLTPEYGLDFISRCRQSGFHPHPTQPPIYEESVHVRMDKDASISVVDLRKSPASV